jgi:hypothetical protein
MAGGPSQGPQIWTADMRRRIAELSFQTVNTLLLCRGASCDAAETGRPGRHLDTGWMSACQPHPGYATQVPKSTHQQRPESMLRFPALWD